MKTYGEILELAKALEDDAIIYNTAEEIHVNLNDSEGFYGDSFRNYDNPEAVENFEEMLSAEAKEVISGFYTTYCFEGFNVIIGYESFESTF